MSFHVEDIYMEYREPINIASETPRKKIIEENGTYMHALVSSHIMHFIDALEVLKPPSEGAL